MARITVEDCLEKIDNRFDLVLIAARRAHQLKSGAAELLPWDDDKPTVLALREVAQGKVDAEILTQPQILSDEEDRVDDLEDLHRQIAESKPDDAQDKEYLEDEELELSEEETVAEQAAAEDAAAEESHGAEAKEA